MSLLLVKTAALPFLKKERVEGRRDERVHRSCHMTRISALTHFACWLHSSGRDAYTQTRTHTSSSSSSSMLFSEDRATMQTSTMSLTRENCVVDNNTLRKKCTLWYRRSLRGSADRHRHETGSLPRVHRPKLNHSNSLVDYTDPQRTTVVLEKQDNETFGFEIQTYGLQQKHATVTEMCTFVCRVHEDSAAESAGLTAGDIIVTINGVSIEGSSHQKILDLIRESTNSLQMETVCGNVVKRIELEKRLNLLKQTLREKLVELQTLTVQEKRLTRGKDDDVSARTSSDSSLCSPVGRYGLRISSDSSFRSVMTDDSDHTSVFGDTSSPGPFSAASTTDDGCFFSNDFSSQESNRRFSSSSSSSPNHQRHHRALGRTSSSGLTGGGGSGSSSSMSPSWEETRISTLFGTLPRKSRKSSMRKHIFKLLPGLQRSVEEEEV